MEMNDKWVYSIRRKGVGIVEIASFELPFYLAPESVSLAENHILDVRRKGDKRNYMQFGDADV